MTSKLEERGRIDRTRTKTKIAPTFLGAVDEVREAAEAEAALKMIESKVPNKEDKFHVRTMAYLFALDSVLLVGKFKAGIFDALFDVRVI